MKTLLLFLSCFFASLCAKAQAPTFQWAKQLGADGYVYGKSIARDAFGDIVTAGDFSGTADFDAAATTLTLNATNGSGFVTRYNPAGNFMWAKQIGNGITTIRVVKLDAAGYIFLGGSFKGQADMDPGAGIVNLTSAGDYDAFVIKLDPSGNFMWAKQMGASALDDVRGLDVDANGNVYITGLFTNTVDLDPGPAVFNLSTNGGYDTYVLKLDGNGTFVWAKGIHGTIIELPRALTVDASGNVHVTGVVFGTIDFDPGPGVDTLTANSDNSFILKLSNTGNYLWAKIFGGPSGGGCAFDIAVDAAGNVYTTGDFSGTSDFDPNAGVSNMTAASPADVFISKLNASGNFVWAKSIAQSFTFGGGNIDLDNLGNIYVTGQFTATTDFDPGSGTYTMAPNNSTAGFILKLNSAANFQWAIRAGDPGAAAAVSTVVDGQGTLYTMGVFSAATDFDHTTATSVLTPFGPMDTFILKLAQPTNGLNENGLAKILSIYPNPAGNTLYIKADMGIDNISLSICDALGKVVLKETMESNSLQLNIEKLSAGIYYLNVLNNNAVIASKKIIKE